MSDMKQLKLENQLCFSLYAASREVIKLYKPQLDPFNLTYTQYITMIVLWEERKMTVKGIGQKLYLDSGTLTPLLKKLEQRGLIRRYRDQNDDRVVIVELTEEGEKLQEQIGVVPGSVYCQMGTELQEAVELKKRVDELLHHLTKIQ